MKRIQAVIPGNLFEELYENYDCKLISNFSCDKK